ncbi:hydantoinase B/oxoprolinase family protein [Paraburkholderia sp.]|uniref:hydantoinase B/oxoprolinase family protein n=1 Tax=Paraburkholderia sp. TaxID=1926495 RepID=UPI0039E248DC
MKMDSVGLRIFSDHCRAAAESMAYTLYRTAHSTFVKETEDFTTGIATPEGLTFASPKELGATWFTGLDYGAAIRLIDNYEEGDICITNDPYNGSVSTHVPDVHLWKPVFYKGEIACFVVGHVHNTDIGGAIPGSLSRTLTDIHQEGLRIPPTKLVSKGSLNDSLVKIITNNVRAPSQNYGDLMAQIGAMNTGTRHALAIIEKFGFDSFKAGVDGLFDLAEAQSREIIRSIPDGSYSFSDFIDEDSVNGLPCRLHLNMIVKGDSLTLDFSGSDPQTQSSLNMPTGGHDRHALLMIGLIYVLYALNPKIQLNAGLLRPCSAIAPLGSILNPVFPAAVGLRSITTVRLMGVILGACGLALPGRLPAAPSSGGPIVSVAAQDPLTGRRFMASLGPVTGGSGGTPYIDGPEASGGNNAFLKNTPVEINESELPIKIRRYSLTPDSSGPGKHRGGLATTLEFEVFAPDTSVAARNRDRSKFCGWGIQGGRAGKPSRFILNPGTDKEVDLGNTDVLKLQPGDVLSVTAGGSGGWGDPFDRDPNLVAQDVRYGFVSVQAAEDDYGVALSNGELDQAKTAKFREAVRNRARPIGVDFGEGRRSYERMWDEEAYQELMERLYRLPVNWRFFIKHRVFEQLANSSASGARGAVAVAQAFDVVLKDHPQLTA